MRGRACLRNGLVCGLGLSALLWAVSGCGTGEPDEPDEPPEVEADSTPTAAVDTLRAEAIRATIASLEEECRCYGGGDWERWSQSLQPYRDALLGRVRALKLNYPESKDPYTHCRILEAAGDPPLFEPEPEGYLRYLFQPQGLEPFRRDRPVAALSRWLRSQGIDLIFMPVPKMTEVYPQRQAQPCPANRIVAPHVRRMLLELLQHDVEILDLLPTFLSAADQNAEPLYFPDDPHWGPRGWHLAAKALAERLQRYGYVRSAREKPRLFHFEERPWAVRGSSYLALSPAQQQRVERARPAVWSEVVPVAAVGTIDQKSPIAFIGDSYNCGLVERVAYELNLPVATLLGGGHTTQAFTEGLRNPGVFRGRKVVVLVVCNTNLSDADWSLPPQLVAPSGKGTEP